MNSINTPSQYQVNVLQRSGHVVVFDVSKVRAALTQALLKDENGKLWVEQKEMLSAGEETMVESLLEHITAAVSRQPNIAVHIEAIQDQVELALMRNAPHKVAAAYILYRERHAAERRQRAKDGTENTMSK